jgi:multidrug efflux pump subunit AcrA (membrane-fusion protein)
MSKAPDSEAELPLFRPEALQHNETQWLGEVVFSQPLALKATAILAVIVVIGTALVGYLGTYTRKSTVVGEIMPDEGVVAVYAQSSGHVVRSNVTEGRHVTQGETLLVMMGQGRQQEPVIAPVSGMTVAFDALPGREVDPARALLSIVPDGSRLEAMLYAPGKDVHRAKVGDTVKLRYEAFPSSRYGLSTGRIVSISQSPLTSAEFASIGEAVRQRIAPRDRGAPLYRLTVALQEPFVIANGRREDLKAHMLLEADVVLETQRLYQRLLD